MVLTKARLLKPDFPVQTRVSLSRERLRCRSLSRVQNLVVVASPFPYHDQTVSKGSTGPATNLSDSECE